MRESSLFNRREFLGLATAGVGALVTSCVRDAPTAPVQDIDDLTVAARPGTPTENVAIGFTPLGIGTARDGFLYVPPSYQPTTPMPLLVLLHEGGRGASDWNAMQSLFDDLGMIIVAPDSRESTWDLLHGGVYGPDVAFLNSALAMAFARCNVDATRVGIGGFSDGASEALGLGIANGDLFSAIIALTPGRLFGPFRRGEPRIFVAHSTEDELFPFLVTQTQIVPLLRQVFPDVQFLEFTGAHALSDSVVQQALDWFVSP